MSEIPGMSEGVEAARIMFQGFEMLIRLGSGAVKWSLEKLIEFGTFMFRLHQTKKTELKPGEVQFSELTKMGDTAVFQVKNNNKEQIIDYLNKAGVTYSILPDLNNNDDFFEIAYLGSQDVAIKNYIAKFPDMARTYTYAEYHDNAQEDIIEKNLDRVVKDDNSASVIRDTIKEDYKSVLENDGFAIMVNTSFMDFSELYNSDVLKVAVANQKDMYIEVGKQRLFGAKNDGEKKYLNIAFKPNEMFVLVNSEGKKLTDSNGNTRFINAEEYENAFKNKTKATKGKSEDNIIHFENIDKSGTRTTLSKIVDKSKNPIIANEGPVKFPAKTKGIR